MDAGTIQVRPAGRWTTCVRVGGIGTRVFRFRNVSHQPATALDPQRDGGSGHFAEPAQHHGTESDRFHGVLVAEIVYGLDGQRVLQKEQIARQLAVHEQPTSTYLNIHMYT